MSSEQQAREGSGQVRTAPTNAFDKSSQRRRKRMTLLNEALRMLHERGATSISLDDLAANLEISKGTVYYYFKSKDELLFECYSISFDTWELALDRADATEGSAANKIETFLRSYLSEGLGTLHAVIYLREQSALQGTYRDEAEKRRRLLRDRLRAIVQQGNADGSMDSANPKVAATILGAAITWLLRAYQPDAGKNREEYIEDAIKILLSGLLTR